MGMFDEVRCDYPLSPESDGDLYQTKDIHGDFGGSGNLYYICPNGYLYYIDYYGVSEWVRDPTKPKPYPYVRVRTGKRGRVTFMSRHTGSLRIISSNHRGRWIDCPQFRLDIYQGQVRSFTPIKHETDARRNDGFQSYTC